MTPLPRSLALLLCCSPVLAQSPQLIAPTDPLPPQEQRAMFHLPPGFEIQLVVAEEVIGQPMNLNFDAAGRLWITSSVEYPYPARGEGVEERDERFGTPGEHAPRDRVVVLEGIGPDGKPARITPFAEGLNIPIGVVPIADGTLVYGIPAIERHRDTDGDGRADETTRLFHGYGNVDTHGMTNGFTRWIDGWIYACHGFRNTSNVRMSTRDGEPVVLTMNSGNTYRFREDGSAIEQFTWGQVNPFGLTFDPWGNAYTSDCHSLPLTMLLRGGYSTSFGKPHDGLGFAPNMIDHNHGSTGICGPAHYAADQFPVEYRDNLFLCNPVTGRVHRDKLIDHGSTRLVDTQPDFVTCDDPWFRPVDCQVGPDGCLYVADFYNAIIGHYEVPLANPKRDRTHGRVWRIVYRGEEGSIEPPSLPNLTRSSVDELLERLGDANLVVRTLATNEIVDRVGRRARDRVHELIVGESSPEQRAHGLWILHRLDTLDDDLVERLANDVGPLVRTHLARSLAERDEWNDRVRSVANGLVTDANGFVRRAAVDAVGRHPTFEGVQRLVEAYARTPEADTHLRHTIRIALRNHVREEAIANALRSAPGFHGVEEVASVSLAVPSASAAAFLVAWMTNTDPPVARVRESVRHVAAHGTEEMLDEALAVLEPRFGDDDSLFHALLLEARSGLRQRGGTPSETLRGVAAERALAFLRIDEADAITWQSNGSVDDPWARESRRCADGRTAEFFSTLPRGETVTGTLRSQPFDLPATLGFHVAGHAGPPPGPPHDRNVVRLREAETGVVLAETSAPRNDVARPVEWDLAAYAGRRGYVELVDGDAGGAYAWLAVGRFSFEPLNPRAFSPGDAAVTLVDEFQLTDLRPALAALLRDRTASSGRRLAAGRALVALDPDPRLDALLAVAGDPLFGNTLREDVLAAVESRAAKPIDESLAAAMQALPAPRQAEFAETLASNRPGGEALLSLVETGRASPRLLVRPQLAERLVAARIPDVERRIAELTRNLPAVDDRIAAAITSHRQSFAAGTRSADSGRLVFEKTCAACHRIGEKGAVVGPQLDGIGLRGLDRLLEDVLDPNRNVDGAFRVTTVVTRNGKVHSGLFRREEGATLVFADQKGQEFTVLTADVDERVLSSLSLMPANVHEILKPQEIDDLLRYLLEQRTAPPHESVQPLR